MGEKTENRKRNIPTGKAGVSPTHAANKKQKPGVQLETPPEDPAAQL
jgi:hypothetical protein